LLHYNILFGLVTGVIMLVLTPQAWSHPHSFIDMQATLIHEDNQQTGLKMHWVIDEITSADLLYDAGDAKPDSVIWKSWWLK